MVRVVIDDEPVDRAAVYAELLARPDETADDRRRGRSVTRAGDPQRHRLVARLQQASLQHYLTDRGM